MTKLFETNSYLKEFKSKVININKEEKKIELEETVFYGKSGGQPGDLGKLIYENIEIEV
tara:strand:- start:147 stop:323 length:177 start_codon:yes stop_codon:yes gene_type:complete